MVQRSRGSPSALPRTRIGFRRGGGTHLGTSHVPGHALRATEECSRHGRCGDRGGERLRCCYGQRKALSRREPPQSAPLGVISGLTLGPNGMKTAQRATLSYEENMVARDGVEPPTPAFSELVFPVFPTTSRVAVGLLNTGKYVQHR